MLKDFPEVCLAEWIITIMMDGRWYTNTVLRRKIRPSTRGVVNGTLIRLRRYGFLRRARNPLNGNLAVHQTTQAPYAYQWTGKPYVFWQARFTGVEWVNGKRKAKWKAVSDDAAKLDMRIKDLPIAWQMLLK